MSLNIITDKKLFYNDKLTIKIDFYYLYRKLT